MANVIRIKRRTSGAPGAPASLKAGEMAYNNVDNTVYIGFGDDGGGNATSIKPMGGEGAFCIIGRNISTAANSGLAGGGDHSADRSLSLDVNNLAAATVPNGTDFIAIFDGTSTKKMTRANFLTGISAGGVTSVGLSAPSIFTVSGSPVTTSGTLTMALASQTANFVFAAPDGTAGAPVFRLLAAADIPSLTAAKISNFDTQVRTSRLDQMAAPTAAVGMNSQRLTALSDPISAQDAATKAYVDASAQGLDVKQSVRVTTTANITLSAPQTIDGVAVVAGDRVLVKDQTTGANNGIYVVAAGSWTRATDADSSAKVTAGMFVFVEQGTLYADSGWVLTTDGAITLGTTSIAFTQFSGAGQIIAGAGLTKTGNTLDIGGTTNRITVNADSIDIAATYVGQTSITTLGTVGTGTWQGTTIAVANGGTGATDQAGARTNLGLGSMATQGAGAVAITGGSVTNLTTFDGNVVDGGTF